MSLENTFLKCLGISWPHLVSYFLRLLIVVWTTRDFISNRYRIHFKGICHYYNLSSTSQTAFLMKKLSQNGFPIILKKGVISDVSSHDTCPKWRKYLWLGFSIRSINIIVCPLAFVMKRLSQNGLPIII